MRKVFIVFIVCIVFLSFALVGCKDTVHTTDGGSGVTGTTNNGNFDQNGPEKPTGDQKILVVYFSATNTTEKIAKFVQNYTHADIFEIMPAVAYTSSDLNYNDSNSRTSKENRDDNSRPEIVGRIENMEQYGMIFLGYPIWHGKAPKVLYTFIEQYDFSGKTIIPFCTAASSGIGASATNLQNLTSGSIWLNGTRFLSSATESSVQTWVDGILSKE